MSLTSNIRSVALSTGVTLQYIEQGDPDGIPVILLHGYSDSVRSQEPLLSYLPDALHVFALTQRGHGDASRPASGYAVCDFAADVAAFMDAMGLSQAIIVGHSMGSAVAQQFTLDYPERIHKLILIGAFDRIAGKPEVIGLWDEAVVHLTDPVDPDFVREFQESTITRPVPVEFLEMVIAESLKLPAHVWKGALTGLLAEDFSDRRHEIAVPTLIIWGDQDSFASRADQESLVRAIAGSELVVYEGIGHAVHWEDPARVAADIVAFSLTTARP